MKVRELIRLLEQDGWFLVRTRGSHRLFKYPRRKGAITIAGKLGVDIPAGTLHTIRKQSGIELEGRKQ